jgi:hypothetical protein
MKPDFLGWLRAPLAILIFVLLAWFLSGCAHKSSAAKVNIILRPECLTKPIVLEDCDSSEPPKCKNSHIAYKSTCAEIQVTK